LEGPWPPPAPTKLRCSKP